MMPIGPPVRRGTNGLAVAGFVLSLLWLCGFGSLLAVIFTLVALGQIKRLGGGGHGLAVAGLVLGVVGLVVTVSGTLLIVFTADEVIDSLEDERNDVDVTGCRAGDGGAVLVAVSITNDSSKPSDYRITVLVSGADTGIGEASQVELTTEALDPGDTTELSARTGGATRFDDPRCELGFVDRRASGG